MSTVWIAIIIMIIGCFGLKIAGLSVPARVLEHPWTIRAADLIPVALLGALIAVQVFAGDKKVEFDARLIGLAVAAGLLALRVPFLPVVVAAAATAALARQL